MAEMREAQAQAWLDQMTAALNQSNLDPEVRTALNEIHRFLMEFCCPNLCAEAQRALIQKLSR